MQIKSYSTIAAAETAIGTPAEGHVVVVNSHLMYYIGADRLTYPGEDAPDEGVWVPWDFRDAYVQAVFDASLAASASPNVDWGWEEVTADGGAVTRSTDETRLDCASGASEKAYVQLVESPIEWGITTDRLCAYVRLKCVSGGDSDGKIKLYMGDDSGLGYEYLIQCRYAADGVAGRIECQGMVGSYTGMGTDFFELLLVNDIADSSARIFNYNTMQQIAGKAYENSGTSTVERFRIGDDGTTDASDAFLKGSPAAVLLIGR